ncbi:MAG: ATP-grasp domain-containing protein [Planctomyces sp.]|nr:ATP-grasp domain-containing protein [Planctomyces sp.]
MLVLGDNDLAALAIVRSLGRYGLTVHLAAFESKPIARRSRYVSQIHDLGHPLADGERFVRGVLGLAQQQGFDLIVPTSDKSLTPLMPHRDELNRHAHFVAPDDVGFEFTSNKDQTLSKASELGIPIPSTTLLSGPEALRGFQLPSDFPVVLKPQASTRAGAVERNEVRIVHARESALEQLDRMLQRGPVLVQGYCPGYGVGLSVLGNAGEVVAAFQHQRVHEPPRGGAGSYRKSVPLDATLLEFARKFCAAIGWSGPAMFEYKVDPATGAAVLMEVNGRFWGSLALAIQSGVDFPRLQYDMAVLGKVQTTFAYRTPYYVRHTIRDVEWFRENALAPRGRPDLRKLGLGEVASEFWNIVTLREGYDIESIRDPMPAVAGWKWFLTDAARQLTRRASMKLGRRRFLRLARAASSPDSPLRAQARNARSILFLCYGNINRSPVAEQSLKAALGSASPVTVASAGFYPERDRSTGPVSESVARQLGLDLTGHRSQVVSQVLLQTHDLIVIMDAAQVQGLREMCPDQLRKAVPLSTFGDTDRDLEIPDPHGKGQEFFEKVYRRIMHCVAGLARELAAGVARNHQPPASD